MLRHQSSQQVYKNLISKQKRIQEDLKSTGTGDGNKGKASQKSNKMMKEKLNNLLLEQTSIKFESSLD